METYLREMRKPNFKINEYVIAKLIVHYNVCKIERMYWCPYRKIWMYTLKTKGGIINGVGG